jgi:hypothetical protein
LYVISSELNLANTISGAPGARDSNAAILDTLRARQQSLDDERQQQRSISLRQTVQLEQSVRGLQAELQQLDKEILTKLRACNRRKISTKDINNWLSKAIFLIWLCNKNKMRC